MNSNAMPEPLDLKMAAPEASTSTIAQLVGEVYAVAPPAEKSRLLSHLMKPLGVLSLVAIANGIFANIRFQNHWPDHHIALEDAHNIQASDVITLANYVQQVSLHAVDNLAEMLSASPLLTSSAAAALLVQVLLQRSKTRRASDYMDIDSLGSPA